MENKNNSNNRILKTFVLNITVSVICLLAVTLFAQPGNSYEMLSVYATAESAEKTAAPTESDEEPTATADDLPTATAEPTPETTSSPEKTDTPDNPETSPPDDTEEPTATEIPSGETESAKPADTETSSPTPTGSVSATNNPTNTARPTPSPTLAWLEAPYVSGDVFVDVEDENYTPTVAPQGTATVDTYTDPGMVAQSAKPENAVKDQGSLSTFFDVMVYIFIGCAVLTAGYAAFLGVKLFMSKKKNQKYVAVSEKEEKSDE